MLELLLVLGILTAGSGVASASELFSILGGQRVGTSSMSFLKIPVGSRAEGMGGAYVALANDAFAAYWNPAGIAQLKNRWSGAYTYDPDRAEPGVKAPTTQYARLHRGNHAIGLVRMDWIADIQYNAISYVQPLPVGVLGLTAASLSMAEMEITTEYHPDGTGEYFRFGDVLMGLTYALPMTDNFSWGLSLKYARETLAQYTMNNVLMDIGTYYWTGYRDLRIGVALMNFGPNAKPDGTFTNVDVNGEEYEDSFTGYAPPTEFRLGGAMTLFASTQHRFLGSIQLNHPVDNAENLKVGGEYSFAGMLFLRGGYKFNTDEDRYSFGGGVRIPIGGTALDVDYSYTDFGILDQTQRFSVGINF